MAAFAGGIAAGGARQWKAANEHFQIAMQQAEAAPNLLEQAEIRRFRAMMLLDRGASGDRGKARTLLSDALQSYTQIGMPRHVEMARGRLPQPTAQPGVVPQFRVVEPELQRDVAVLDHALAALREKNPPLQTEPKKPRRNLVDVLSEPPFAGSELNLERIKDYPRPLDF